MSFCTIQSEACENTQRRILNSNLTHAKPKFSRGRIGGSTILHEAKRRGCDHPRLRLCLSHLLPRESVSMEELIEIKFHQSQSRAKVSRKPGADIFSQSNRIRFLVLSGFSSVRVHSHPAPHWPILFFVGILSVFRCNPIGLCPG